MRLYILDGDTPVPCIAPKTWAEWFEKDERRIVARTNVTADVIVSTVFVGIDHAFHGGPPVLWETMVFGGKLDQKQRRYASAAAARKGHAMMVAEVTGAASESGVTPC